jgi:pimeloyl-ACP methyl ester carboxylesterase
MGAIRGWVRLSAATVAGVLAVAVVPAVQAGPASAAAKAAFPIPSITWQECPPGTGAAQVAGFTCATVHVPLDYRLPAGPTINLVVVRHAAAVPARRGMIFLNPGGPGDSGTLQFAGWIGRVPETLLRDYDIISWDPRGVGQSTAVQCFPNFGAELRFLGEFFYFPASPRQQADYIRRLAGYGGACYPRNGDLLRHLSTADTARDLDLLRGALGQPKLNFLGLSYGTYLGATYANMFPNRVGKMVLDGNIAPSAWTNGGRPDASESFSMREGSTTEVIKTLAAFLRICGQRSTQDCAFSAGSPARTTAKWTALLARLRRGPITVDATTYTYTQLVTLVRNLLFFVQPLASPVIGAGSPGWPGAAALLQDLWTARKTKPGTTPAPPPSVGGPTERYAGFEQFYSVICGDAPSPPANGYPSLQRRLLSRGPRPLRVISLVGLWTDDEPCATWPVQQQNTYRGPWNAPTPPILLVNLTTDPATPLQNAIKMTHELANTRLLIVNGYGHTAFLNPSSCANNYETAYFSTGALPAQGTICQKDLPPFPPAGGNIPTAG